MLRAYVSVVHFLVLLLLGVRFGLCKQRRSFGMAVGYKVLKLDSLLALQLIFMAVVTVGKIMRSVGKYVFLGLKIQD